MSEAVFTRAGVIASEADTKSYEGAGIFDAALALKSSLNDQNWASAGANAAVVGLSALSVVMDPFQVIFAAGVGWLMEHVSILREPLDWLAGDPKEIEAHAKSWRNIEQRLYEATDFYVEEIKRSAAEWASQAASVYRAMAKEHVESVQTLGVISDILAEVTLVAGAMVGVVRSTVRDLIAEVVGAAVSKAVQAILVVTIPKIVADVAVMVAKYAAKITGLLRELLEAISRVSAHLPKLKSLLDRISSSLAKGSNNAVILCAYRTEAAVVAADSGRSLAGLKLAYATVSGGHRAAHGGAGQIAAEVYPTASRNTGIQNAGQVIDSYPDDDAKSGKIDLPL